MRAVGPDGELDTEQSWRQVGVLSDAQARVHLGFDGVADGGAMAAMRPSGELPYTVVDETHHWSAEDTAVFAEVTERVAEMASRLRVPSYSRARQPSRDPVPPDEHWTPATADTSQPYCLNLIRRIDDVTEGS